MLFSWRIYWILLVISFAIFLISKDFILFWDTIQFGGKHPLYYFENLFSADNWEVSNLFLPGEIDSGHCPVFGIYLAIVWKFIGKSLLNAHFAMLPFVFLSLIFAFKLGCKWIEDSSIAMICPLLIILIPQSISQFMLVSPDVVLLAFFLMSLYGLKAGSPRLLVGASIGLGLISNRGSLLVIALVLWHLASNINATHRKNLYLISSFIPALIAILSYQVLHKILTGWSGLHVDMPWLESFKMVGVEGVLKNVGIYIWRLSDFGMIFIWLGLIWQFAMNKVQFIHCELSKLLLILISIFALVTIPFSGLMQHRYFLPIYVLASVIFFKNVYINRHIKSYFKKEIVVAIGITIGLITGNFWIYPNSVSQGWDSTLAHLPYYSLQSEMTMSIEKRGIDIGEVGTEFPMRSSFKELFLNEDIRQYPRKNLSSQNYILWSNVCNDYSLSEIKELQAAWKPVVELEKLGVKMKLYQKNLE